MSYLLSIFLSTYISRYLKRFLGAGGPEAADVEAMKSELTELQQKVEKLNEENSDLKRKVGLVLFADEINDICIISIILEYFAFHEFPNFFAFSNLRICHSVF